jgi:hypothetical protein
MFLRGLELEIFYHNDFSEALEELEIDSPLHTYNRKKATFYSINAVTTYLDEKDNDKPYARIYSGADVFVSTQTRERLRDIIDEHLRTTATMMN